MRELCYTDYDVTCTSVGRVLEWCWKSVGVVLKMAVIIMVIMVFLVMFTVVNTRALLAQAVYSAGALLARTTCVKTSRVLG
jgi:hypothetical protein